MMQARFIQFKLTRKLEGYFDKVEIEWSIARNASDGLARDVKRYAPRLDIAVGPFSIEPGNRHDQIEKAFLHDAPPKLRKLLARLPTNPNPRCALVIEVVFSGSSKHILGDITNASMMGLYGVVVPSQKTVLKVKRVFEYVKILKSIGKAPDGPFSNVAILTEEEISMLL